MRARIKNRVVEHDQAGQLESTDPRSPVLRIRERARSHQISRGANGAVDTTLSAILCSRVRATIRTATQNEPPNISKYCNELIGKFVTDTDSLEDSI
jgi:hypothetical protein